MKIGTIGSGMIVDRFIHAVSLVDHVSIEAVYSRSEEKAAAFASKHGIVKHYTDIDKMLADTDIDTIYVASPNSLHYAQALQALQAGKNVIGEKPFTSTLEETDILIKTAKEKNLFLFEAITTIHMPNYKIVKENLATLGNIHLVTANFSQYSSKFNAYKNNELPNAFNPKFSGGALMDINIYNIHFVVGLFGKPKSYAYYPNLGYNGIDTSGVMIMQYDSFTATLIGAKDSSSEYLCFVQGDASTIKVSGASTGVCKTVERVPLLGDSIDKHNPTYNFENMGIEQDFHMSYEVADFEAIIQNKDYEACYKLLDHTRDVMEILYNARIKAGIYFPADNV